MFCRNCGNEIPEGSKFCAKCGTPAFVTAPDSQKAPAGGMAAPGPGLTPNYAQPAPAYNTGTYYNTQPKEPVKRAITKWPASIGVMGILYLVFYLASMAANYLSFEDIYLMPFGVFFGGTRIIYILLAIGVPVLFFVHTRKLAFLTAIPMVISLVMHGISFFSSWGYMDSTVLLRGLLSFVPGLILVVLYVIQMFVRPRNAALSIIYLILAILNLLQSAGLLVVDVLNDYAYVYPSEYFLMSNVLGIVASIFLTIAYCKAMFVSRKKYYKQ